MKEEIETRKKDHIDLTMKSQMIGVNPDSRFDYEPLLSSHPSDSNFDIETPFLGYTLKAPIWISSMTGGTQQARKINQNLARAANEFGLGMGLGSCRALLENEERWEDFNLRPILGKEVPFFANLGICQLEKIIEQKEFAKVEDLLGKLEADGLIVHVNPLQEWFQDEGDFLEKAPIETIQKVLEQTSLKIIVKEVGQGMGPRSLKALLELPLAAIDFAAFGGTNFSTLEKIRSTRELLPGHDELCLVGHKADEMVENVLELKRSLGEKAQCKNFIVSGGIQNYLQGYYLIQKLGPNSIYGQAKMFLEHAKDGYEPLESFVRGQCRGLALAKSFLKLKQ